MLTKAGEDCSSQPAAASIPRNHYLGEKNRSPQRTEFRNSEFGIPEFRIPVEHLNATGFFENNIFIK